MNNIHAIAIHLKNNVHAHTYTNWTCVYTHAYTTTTKQRRRDWFYIPEL